MPMIVFFIGGFIQSNKRPKVYSALNMMKRVSHSHTSEAGNSDSLAFLIFIITSLQHHYTGIKLALL